MNISNTDSQALPTGTRLEEFMIERVLGAGGFGITYLARDVSLNRQVVIKENLPAQFAWRDSATGTVRPRHSSGGDVDDYQWSMNNFLREAETLASLDHSGIVQVLRKFETNDTAYFVMPFLEGIPFDELIDERSAKDKPFSQDELLGLTTRILDALGYLHARGIYHRDIKPGNILITQQGLPVLIDFGSARQCLSERSMTVIESPGYTPFEQLQTRGKIGPWSDLYAFGATLAKAITFETPPKAADRMIEDSWPGLAIDPWSQAYQRAFLQAIDRSMAIDVSRRWQSADAWRQFLNSGNSDCMRSGGHWQHLHCPHKVNVAGGRPGPDMPRSVRIVGSRVLLAEGYQLPDSNCVCCGSPSVRRYTRSFGYTPPAVWIAVIAPLILIILLCCLHKERKLRFGLCDEHVQRIRRMNIICWSSGLLFIPAWIWASSIDNSTLSSTVALLGFALFINWIVFCNLARPLKIEGLENGYIKIRGVCATLRESLKS